MRRLYLCLFVALVATSLLAQSDFFYSKNGEKEVFKIRKDLVVFKTKSPNMQGLNTQTVQFKSLDRLPDGLIKATIQINSGKRILYVPIG